MRSSKLIFQKIRTNEDASEIGLKSGVTLVLIALGHAIMYTLESPIGCGFPRAYDDINGLFDYRQLGFPGFNFGLPPGYKAGHTRGNGAALVSFTWQTGTENLRASTLLQKVNDRRFEELPNEFLKWIYFCRLHPVVQRIL